MPHYDYKCEKCGVFEVEQSIKDNPYSKCPKCGGNVKRLISASGIMFKGSGFYVTDSKGSKQVSAPKKNDSKKKAGSKKENKGK